MLPANRAGRNSFDAGPPEYRRVFDVQEGQLGKVIVSDPCYLYTRDALPASYLKLSLRPGQWWYRVKRDAVDTGRVAALELSHEDYRASGGKRPESLIELPVDSGQMGVFLDYRLPPVSKAQGRDTPEFKEFYETCCKKTVAENYGILDEIGVVCQTGYGDGMYPIYANRDEAEDVTKIAVIFIDDEDSDGEQEVSELSYDEAEDSDYEEEEENEEELSSDEDSEQIPVEEEGPNDDE